MMNLFNRLIVLSKPELRGIRKVIINAARTSPRDNAMIAACDDIFLERLARFPIALTLSFWEKHLEWQAIKEYPEITGRMLDFGCGSGHSDIFLARKGMNVHGLDMSPIGIAIANYLKTKENPSIKNRLAFSVADVTKDLPENMSLFDSAWSSNVFEHIAQPGPIFRGLRKWLKPGAFMLISVPLGLAHDDPSHVNHFFNEQDLISYINDHVKVVKIDISKHDEAIRALCLFN